MLFVTRILRSLRLCKFFEDYNYKNLITKVLHAINTHFIFLYHPVEAVSIGTVRPYTIYHSMNFKHNVTFFL